MTQSFSSTQPFVGIFLHSLYIFVWKAIIVFALEPRFNSVIEMAIYMVIEAKNICTFMYITDGVTQLTL